MCSDPTPMLCIPILLHCFPEQILVHRAKDFVGQFERPNFCSAQIVNIYSCHMLLMQARASRPSTTLSAMPSSPPSSPPSTDQLSSARQIRAALLAASSLW